MSWLERLTGGFKKTADRLGENISGLVKEQALDTATLDDIEEALIASDLGPEASKRIRDSIAARRYDQLDERGLRTILAEEIEKILAPVAKPLDVWGFPRPHVILVIGVNGSGKTTTIGKLGHLLQEQDYGVMLAAGDTFRAAAIEQLKIWGERIKAPVISGKEGGDAAGIVYDGVKQATATGIAGLGAKDAIENFGLADVTATATSFSADATYEKDGAADVKAAARSHAAATGVDAGGGENHVENHSTLVVEAGATSHAVDVGINQTSDLLPIPSVTELIQGKPPETDAVRAADAGAAGIRGGERRDVVVNAG